jgi:mannose-6-phosphate isomerase-like protein (cupin superfamily)
MREPGALVCHPLEEEEYDTPERCRILESWNREDDPAMSIARARVAPGITTRLHRLTGITERYFILSGEGLVEVSDQTPQPVTAGDVVYIPAGCPQRIRNTGEDDLVFVALCTPRFVPSAYEDIDPDT